MKPVMIKWYDSVEASGWRDWDEYGEVNDTAALCCSVGFLVFDGENVKILAPHVMGRVEGRNIPKQACGIMEIPTGAILSITDLSHHLPPDVGDTG